MAKYISDAALQKQQEQASALKNYIRSAAKLADETVEIMLSLPHIERDDERARTPTAHGYWRAYFWYTTPTGDRIGAGFGYDLQQWKADTSNPSIPPWRLCLYLWHADPQHQPKVIKDFTAIREHCQKKGWWDDLVDTLPVEEGKSDKTVWLPVPKEFVEGITESAPSAHVPFLLAGAVNAFVGSLVQECR